MTPSDLLAELRALDIRVHVDGGRLRISAPKGRLTKTLEAALIAGKDALLRELEAKSEADILPQLTAAPRVAASLPLSFFQERLWVLDRLQPGSTTYNFGSLFSPSGAVDLEQLQAAIRRVVARHEILRARFILEGDSPVARVASSEDTPIVVRDLRSEPEAAQPRLLDAAMAEAMSLSFDLAAGAPVRFQILRTAEARVSLLISAHHIALDAWSFALLVRDIQSEYRALAEGRAASPPNPLQYADFAHWQRRVSAHPSGIAQLAYWKKRLAALPNLSVFPRDQLARAEAGKGATFDFEWPTELYSAARALAREAGATLYMVLLAAVAAVLHRHTGQQDLALGSPLGTRDREALESMIGPIVSPIVLRFDLSDDPSFEQLVARAREELLEGHAHQAVPFEQIVRELNPERSLNSSPLFQVAVVLHNAPDASELRITSGGAVYDLTLFATERNGTLTGSYEYRTDAYEAATVARIAGHVQNALACATQNSRQRVSELSLLGEQERQQLLEGFNHTEAEVERATVVTQFARLANERGNEPAIVASDRSLTYRELDRLSSQVAVRLRAVGAGPGRFVALATDRTSALPIALLGILKSGAAYVPIDPSYPAERVAFMLKDSGAEPMLTTRAMLKTAALRDATATPLVIDELTDQASEASGDLHDLARPGDVAYLIYTSGSTGTPKGVLVPHSGMSNFLAAMRSCLDFSARDAVLAVTSPSFDISVLELLLPLVQGGRVVLADRETASDGKRLAQLLESSGATMLQSTPSSWRLLMNAGWEGNPALTAIVGGEPLPPALAAWLRPRVRALWNAYGPTETTVWSTMARITDDGPITIGTPIANTQVYVLDAHQRPVPMGALGEICIAGDGVTLGYHGRPELTAERFVTDLAVPSKKMYRTGDIGRFRADGRLEHLGRLDGQVKVRGHRIETGEIEVGLANHPSVKQAVVDVRFVAPDDPRLVAWVQLRDNQDATGSELRRHLRQRLPEFMIPSMVTFVDMFPLTPNGKVDRRALPDAFAAESSANPRADNQPPSTATEKAIAEIWMRLLNVKRVAVSDTFFELGGHSLLAMRAANELAQRMGFQIETRLLFFLSLGQIAEACDARGTGVSHSP